MECQRSLTATLLARKKDLSSGVFVAYWISIKGSHGARKEARCRRKPRLCRVFGMCDEKWGQLM